MKLFVSTLFYFWLVACDNNNNSKPESLNNKHDFFPVNAFLKGQVHEVDSLQLPVHKYTRIDKSSDSVLISQEEYESLAKEFMDPDINDPSIRGLYKETSFADQSIPSITFTYSTQDKNLPLQRMDVIVNPDPVLNDQVKTVYLEKFKQSGDTLFIKKLYWKTNRYFQILTTRQVKGLPSLYSEVKVSWTATD